MKTRKNPLTALVVGAILLTSSLCNNARAQDGAMYGFSHESSDSSWSDIRSDFAASMPHRDDFRVYMQEPFAALPNLSTEAYFDAAAPEPSTASLFTLAVLLLASLKFLRNKLALRPARINVQPTRGHCLQGC